MNCWYWYYFPGYLLNMIFTYNQNGVDANATIISQTAAVRDILFSSEFSFFSVLRRGGSVPDEWDRWWGRDVRIHPGESNGGASLANSADVPHSSSGSSLWRHGNHTLLGEQTFKMAHHIRLSAHATEKNHHNRSVLHEIKANRWIGGVWGTTEADQQSGRERDTVVLGLDRIPGTH